MSSGAKLINLFGFPLSTTKDLSNVVTKSKHVPAFCAQADENLDNQAAQNPLEP